MKTPTLTVVIMLVLASSVMAAGGGGSLPSPSPDSLNGGFNLPGIISASWMTENDPGTNRAYAYVSATLYDPQMQLTGAGWNFYTDTTPTAPTSWHANWNAYGYYLNPGDTMHFVQQQQNTHVSLRGIVLDLGTYAGIVGIGWPGGSEEYQYISGNLNVSPATISYSDLGYWESYEAGAGITYWNANFNLGGNFIGITPTPTIAMASTVTPEPVTLAFLALGGLGIIACRWRKPRLA